MIKLGMILFLILPFFGVTSNELLTLNGDRNRVTSYLASNIGLLNSLGERLGQNIQITGIEEVFEIEVYQDNKSRICNLIDFNQDEGYFILGDNYQIYDWQMNKEQPYERLEDDVKHWYILQEYYYQDNKGNMHSVNYMPIDTKFSNAARVEGQEFNVTGFGKIVDPDLYVKNRFANDFVLNNSRCKSLNVKRYHQGELTVYVKNNRTEGNCAITSGYTVLQYLQENRYYNMPSRNQIVSYDPYIKEYNLYCEKIAEPNVYVQKISFPMLYAYTREKCYNIFGRVENFAINDVSVLMEKVAADYKYTSFDAVEQYGGWYSASIASEIDANRPVIFATANGTYGQHMMVINGYRYYTRSVKYLWFTRTEEVLLYEVCDGHSTTPRYYDITSIGTLACYINFDY